MRYPPDHGHKSRQRIVRSARILFNRHGFDAVSIDRVMAHAGLTRGGFYKHFRGKTDLYAAAIESAYQNPLHGITPDCTSVDVARTLVDAYLSRSHLENVDAACPMITLPSDVARADPAVKQIFQRAFLAMAEVFSRCSEREARKGRARDRALAAAAICVGSMVVSRALDDTDLGESVRAEARRLTLELLRLR